MTKWLTRWILLVFAVVVAAVVCNLVGLPFELQDLSNPGNILQLFLGVALLAVLNATLGTVLRIGTLPLTCMTLGLFSLVINAFIVWLAAQFRLGFRIEGDGLKAALTAFVAAVVISVVQGLLKALLPDEESKKRRDREE